MELIMTFIKCFITGGILCVIGQIFIDTTKLTPARILVFYVTMGVILTALGIYDYIVEFGGSGATVPLTGFGYNLAKGVFSEIDKIGFLGIFSGSVKAAASGITAAIVFGYIASIFAKPNIPSKK